MKATEITPTDEEILDDACAILENTGYSLIQDKTNTRVLLEMQERIKTLTETTKNDDLVFLDYSITLLIDDIWYNLMVDVSYEITKAYGAEIRDGMLDKIGKSLINLSMALREKDNNRYKKFYEEYREIANAYWALIRRLRG